MGNGTKCQILTTSSGVCRLRGAGFGFLMGAPAFELPRLAKAAANCANLRLPALSDKNSTPAAFKGALDGGLSGGDAFAVTCLEASDRSRADMGGNGELLHAPSDAGPGHPALSRRITKVLTQADRLNPSVRACR